MKTLNTETKVIKARRWMKEAFDADLNFKEAYVANIAMLLHDQFGITDYITRNDAGEKIVKLIFY